MLGSPISLERETPRQNSCIKSRDKIHLELRDATREVATVATTGDATKPETQKSVIETCLIAKIDGMTTE